MDEISIDYNVYVGAIVTGYQITNVKSEGSEFVLEGKNTGLDSNTDGNGNTMSGVEANGEQKFKTEELEWKIWDYNNNTKTIRLISSKPTNSAVTLKGAIGYNNGVWAINEVCRQCYGQYEESSTNLRKGITVANLRLSDIQNVSTYDYTKFKHDGNETGWEEKDNGEIQFGNTKTYENPIYPKMWINYDSKWKGNKENLIWEKENEYENEDESITATGNIEFRQSCYSHDFFNKQDEFINSNYYDLLFKDETGSNFLSGLYWLGGRYVHLYDKYCNYGIQAVRVGDNLCQVNGSHVLSSNSANVSFYPCNKLRPIVSIDLMSSDYYLKKITDDSEKVKFTLLRKE